MTILVGSAAIESFETARLIVERLGFEHFQDICTLHTDARVMKTLSEDGRVVPDDVTRQGLVRHIEHWHTHGFGLWVFRSKDRDRFVGRGGLQRYNIEGKEVVGLAYAVLSSLWGQGYATEMAEASLRIGFNRLCLESICSWTLPENKASQRVMEKTGFRYEGDFDFAGLRHRFYRVGPRDLLRQAGGG